MSEQYFLVRKFGLGKEVESLSLVGTEVSQGGGIRCQSLSVTALWPVPNYTACERSTMRVNDLSRVAARK